MINKMQFNVSCVKKYLKENKKVFTVRGYKMEDKEVLVDGIGLCKREFIKQIYLASNLKEFEKESGFNSAMGWWDVIQKMCKDKTKYLYLITVIYGRK